MSSAGSSGDEGAVLASLLYQDYAGSAGVELWEGRGGH